jgi:uncharacterized protein (DUF362 family)
MFTLIIKDLIAIITGKEQRMSKMNIKIHKMKRRDFLKYAGISMAAVALPKAATSLSYLQEKKDKAEDVPSVAPREKISNPYMKNGKPMVAVVEGDNIEAMLMKAFEALGGLEKIAKGRTDAMLKPNFVYPSMYPEITMGETLKSIYAILEKIGVQKISIADGGIRMMERAFERSGLKEFAQKSAAKLIDMNKSAQVMVKSEQFPLLKNMNVFIPAYKTPLLINMPTLKNHHAASLTCALKNSIGCIFRDDRFRLHKLASNEQGTGRIEDFKKAIAEIACACSPDLHIIDAREILVGNQHISRGGEMKKTGVLIVSADPVAADAYAARIMAQHNPDFSLESTQPTLKCAEELGLGTANLDNVELLKLAA